MIESGFPTPTGEVTGGDSFRLRANYWPARAAMYWWDEVSFPTVDQDMQFGAGT
jgi:hypothetical protein